MYFAVRPTSNAHPPNTAKKSNSKPGFWVRLACDNDYQNNNCCYLTKRSYREAAPVKNVSQPSNHFPFTFNPSSIRWRPLKIAVHQHYRGFAFVQPIFGFATIKF
jgi:hypothetical protein